MRTETQRRADEESARRWLRQQLEWESILAALRDAKEVSAVRPVRVAAPAQRAVA